MEYTAKRKAIEEIYGMLDTLEDMPAATVNRVRNYLANILWV